MPASFPRRFYVINGVASPLLNTSIKERGQRRCGYAPGYVLALIAINLFKCIRNLADEADQLPLEKREPRHRRRHGRRHPGRSLD